MIVLMFIAGVGISTLAMFTGLGGGVLWMPLLLSGVGLPTREAVLCALLIQTFGQASASYTNWRRGMIDTPLLFQQARIAVPMTIAGGFLGRGLAAAWIELVLGLLIFVIVYAFLRGDDLFEEGGEVADLDQGRRIRGVSAIGSVFTGLLSIGIGDWLVPLFNRRCGLSMPRAVATAVALMLLLSTLASATHLALGGRVPWQLTVSGIAGVILGAQWGARLHTHLSEVRFKEVFVLLLLLLGAHVTFNAL